MNDIKITTIDHADLLNIPADIPTQIWLRLKLNEAGFRFKDDGKISSAINEKPIPLGILTIWEDPQAKIWFKQVIEDSE